MDQNAYGNKTHKICNSIFVTENGFTCLRSRHDESIDRNKNDRKISTTQIFMNTCVNSINSQKDQMHAHVCIDEMFMR